MRFLLLSILLVSATALPAENVSLEGKWKVHTDVGGNESDSTCAFTMKEDALTGSCMTDSGDKPLTGKIDGKVITWSYESEYEGSPLTIKYRGTLDAAATKLSGSVHVDPFGVDGDFTAIPTK